MIWGCKHFFKGFAAEKIKMILEEEFSEE